jgi:hypothetical protein
MLQNIQKNLPFIAFIELLVIIGLFLALNSNAKNCQSESLRAKAEYKSNIDSLTTANIHSNNLILAQSLALQLSLEQNQTKHEIQDFKFKISVIDTADLTNSYEQALRSVNSYLENRKQQKRFNDSLRALQAHRSK